MWEADPSYLEPGHRSTAPGNAAGLGRELSVTARPMLFGHATRGEPPLRVVRICASARHDAEASTPKIHHLSWQKTN
jgi:hypothetical protein